MKASNSICLIAKNETNERKYINLFYDTENVISGLPNVSIEKFQRDITSNKYEIGIIDIKASAGSELRDLEITLQYIDVFGNEITRTLKVTDFISKKKDRFGMPLHYQSNKVTIVQEFEINTYTSIFISAPPKSEFSFYFLPLSKMHRAIKQIKEIKHDFVNVLVNKLNECAQTDKLPVSYDFRQINDIDALLLNFNEIPADFYRNMVNLYVAMQQNISHRKENNKWWSIHQKEVARITELSELILQDLWKVSGIKPYKETPEEQMAASRKEHKI